MLNASRRKKTKEDKNRLPTTQLRDERARKSRVNEVICSNYRMKKMIFG